jgi:hypothetical protein
MKSVDFLYVALGAFFLIQGGYVLILIRNYSALSRQLKELGKGK